VNFANRYLGASRPHVDVGTVVGREHVTRVGPEEASRGIIYAKVATKIQNGPYGYEEEC
jgi:hypothetical protein